MLTRTAGALLILLVAVPASSLENIQNVHWFIETGDYQPDRTLSWLSFDAEITALDHAVGVSYSVVEIDENGGPAALIWHYANDGFTSLPAAGGRVQVTAGLEFSCDPEGRLLPIGIATWVSYCPTETTADGSVFRGVGNGSVGGPFALEVYEFGLLDEHGTLVPTTTPLDVFTPCVAQPGVAAATGADIVERMARFRQDQVNASLQPGDSGSIGLYFDREGTICSGTIEPGMPRKIYVIAKTRGLTECGFAGAEFRFTGIPPSWQVSPVAQAGVVAFGNPLGDGTTLGMKCQNPEDNLTILYEVDVLATDLVEDVSFKLEPHVHPVGSYTCPLVVLCDRPHYTQVCIESIPCHFNPSSPKGCEGVVAVEKTTWSLMKVLYR